MLGTTPSAYVADVTSNATRTQGLALLRAAGDFGLMLGASLLGITAELFGIPFAMGANACVLAGVSLLFAWRAREPRNIPKQ